MLRRRTLEVNNGLADGLNVEQHPNATANRNLLKQFTTAYTYSCTDAIDRFVRHPMVCSSSSNAEQKNVMAMKRRCCLTTTSLRDCRSRKCGHAMWKHQMSDEPSFCYGPVFVAVHNCGPRCGLRTPIDSPAWHGTWPLRSPTTDISSISTCMSDQQTAIAHCPMLPF